MSTITKTQKLGIILKRAIKLTILLGLIILVNKGVNLYQEKMDIKNYVEPYCAVKYVHDVDEYKSCKELKPIQLIQNLKDNVNNVSEVPNLPLIGM